MKALAEAAPLPGSPLPRSGRNRHVPFTVHLDMRVDSAEDGQARVSFAPAPHMLNNHGAVHGGVLMTLLDIAMANAALSKVDYVREVVTVDMHVGFMAISSGALAATGRAIGGGRSICFCEAYVEDSEGRRIAQAMGTFRYRDPAPA